MEAKVDLTGAPRLSAVSHLQWLQEEKLWLSFRAIICPWQCRTRSGQACMLFCFVVFSTPLLELVKDKFSLVLREGRGDAVEAAVIAPYYVEHVPRELT